MELKPRNVDCRFVMKFLCGADLLNGMKDPNVLRRFARAEANACHVALLALCSGSFFLSFCFQAFHVFVCLFVV